MLKLMPGSYLKDRCFPFLTRFDMIQQILNHTNFPGHLAQKYIAFPNFEIDVFHWERTKHQAVNVLYTQQRTSTDTNCIEKDL